MKPYCTTIIGTPRNSYEQNITEACFPFIFWLLIRVFRNVQAVIHDFLFHWGRNDREKSHFGPIKSPKLPLDITFMPTNYLEGMPEKKPFLPFHHTHKLLEFIKCYWNFDWNRVLWSDEMEIELFGNQHSRWVWKEKACTENNLCVSMVEVEVLWCCGAVFPPKALGILFG